MSGQTPYDEEITVLEKEHTRIGGELNEAQLKRARFLCPFQVGDILVNCHGQKAQVVSISRGWGDYDIKGAIIRKDGTPGRIARLCEWDKWKKEVANA